MTEPQSTPEQMAAGKSHGGIGGSYKVRQVNVSSNIVKHCIHSLLNWNSRQTDKFMVDINIFLRFYLSREI